MTTYRPAQSRGFLVDGFPRELTQAKEFESIVSDPEACEGVRRDAIPLPGPRWRLKGVKLKGEEMTRGKWSFVLSRDSQVVGSFQNPGEELESSLRTGTKPF